MFDMFEVQFWAKTWCSEVFEDQSCCYVTRLVLEHTVRCSQTVVFFWCWHVRSSILGQNVMFENSMFRHLMFRVVEVQYFGVRSKTNTRACKKVCVLTSPNEICDVDLSSTKSWCLSFVCAEKHCGACLQNLNNKKKKLKKACRLPQWSWAERMERKKNLFFSI